MYCREDIPLDSPGTSTTVYLRPDPALDVEGHLGTVVRGVRGVRAVRRSRLHSLLVLALGRCMVFAAGSEMDVLIAPCMRTLAPAMTPALYGIHQRPTTTVSTKQRMRPPQAWLAEIHGSIEIREKPLPYITCPPCTTTTPPARRLQLAIPTTSTTAATRDWVRPLAHMYRVRSLPCTHASFPDDGIGVISERRGVRARHWRDEDGVGLVRGTWKSTTQTRTKNDLLDLLQVRERAIESLRRTRSPGRGGASEWARGGAARGLEAIGGPSGIGVQSERRVARGGGTGATVGKSHFKACIASSGTLLSREAQFDHGTGREAQLGRQKKILLWQRKILKVFTPSRTGNADTTRVFMSVTLAEPRLETELW
ncbi:hypothetical protein C8R46DRAFT_1196159 [Mycena filopes]|nr:hypothetical protein C8R46DRAFT_1196159 [Mycena filopes]